MRLFKILPRSQALQWLWHLPADRERPAEELFSIVESRLPASFAESVLKGILDRYSHRC